MCSRLLPPPVMHARVCACLCARGFFRDKDHREGGSKILIRSDVDSRILTNDLYMYIYIYMSSRITISFSLLARHFNLANWVFFLIVDVL